jgi:hypothetical protein
MNLPDVQKIRKRKRLTAALGRGGDPRFGSISPISL